MLRHIFRYTFTVHLREKSVLFWSLAFPLILVTLFSAAFSNLSAAEGLNKAIPLAYVAPATLNPMESSRNILESIPLHENSQDKLFALEDADDEETARQMVIDGKAEAALVDGASPRLLVTEVSLDQVVVKQVVDSIAHSRSTVVSLMRLGSPQTALLAPEQINSANFIQPVPLNKNLMDHTITYFFALLAMTCLGACTAGAMTIITMQADKSLQGARVSVAPANKWLRTFGAGLAGFLVQLALVMIVLAYVVLVLGKNLGNQMPWVVMILSLGTLLGYLMGMAVACIVRGSENAILGFNTGIYLFSSFLAGLMSHAVKRLVDKAVPFIGQINPASMVTDSLHSLYYYDALDPKYIISMLLLSLVFMFIISLTLRRRYHDSI